METSPFEDLLKLIARDIAAQGAAQGNLDEQKIMYILREHFNPFSPRPSDAFAGAIKMPSKPQHSFNSGQI